MYKVGDQVTIVNENPQDETFDPRFAGKTGTITTVHTDLDAIPLGVGETELDPMYSVTFDAAQFSEDEPIPENVCEDQEQWKERISLNHPVGELFWGEEFTQPATPNP